MAVKKTEALKSFWEKSGPVMMVVMVVLGFALGSLWSKVKYLEKGGQPGQANQANQAGQVQKPAAKYATFGAALEVYAKEIGLDEDKLVKCVESGSKKQLVEAQIGEGQSAGVQGTPGFFINGVFLGGAFPYEAFKEIIDKQLAGRVSEKIEDYSQVLQDAAKQGAFNPVPKKVEIGDAPVRGGKGQITLIEFSDFQCPFCVRVKPTVDKILSDYEGKVVLAYKHFPLTQIHANAQKAAEAAECARDQNKFWEMHDKLFETQGEWAGV